MGTLFQLLAAGIAIGSLYGLVSLGFLTVYHSTGIVNFAQGDVLMVGAAVTYISLTSWNTGYGIAAVLVVFVSVALALAFRYLLIAGLTRRGHGTGIVMLATIVFSLVIQQIFEKLLGSGNFTVPSVLPNVPVRLLDISVLPQTIIAVLVAWILVLAVWLFFTKTLTGRALRAVGMNRTGAAVSGANVQRLITLGVIVSFVVTGIAGLVIAPILGADSSMGLNLAVKGFAAAAIAGFGSVYWGMVAGVALGVIEQTSSFYISSEFAQLITYVLLIVLLVFQGRSRQGVHA